MSNENASQLTPEEQAEIQHQILASAKLIHAAVEQLIGDIESFIELTRGDLSLVMDDLKRMANFLDAVIEAHPITFSLSEIMTALDLNESTIRELFISVGVNLDAVANNPDETITQKDVIALLADRAGSREGDLLADFLRGDSPRVVWS